MRLYDTLRRKIVPFEPGPVVTMYTCGITPYDSTHLGHAATYLTYDVLQRRLRDAGHETRAVRNITDVDDSILPKARELGVHYLDLAAAEMARFDADMEALGMLPAYSEPRATSAIPDIRGFIGMVIDTGHAYEAGGSVYFEVATFPRFGELSGYSRDEMLELAAERGGNVDDPNKRDPLDFVLWQPSAECESAQSEAATGEPFVRHWMHQAMVRMDGEKMSKSLGNLVFVSELSKSFHPMAIRLGVLTNHYRTEWEYSDELMPDAQRRWERWLAAGEGTGALDDVRAALDDDLDTPAAIAAIDAAAERGEGVSEAAMLLGVDFER